MKTLADEIAALREKAHNVIQNQARIPERPTIEELEELLNSGDTPPDMEILPNGEVRAKDTILFVPPATMKRILEFNKECVEVLKRIAYNQYDCPGYEGRCEAPDLASAQLAKLREPV